jgi:hypothetical protein
MMTFQRRVQALSDNGLALLYWRENIKPGLVASGTPQDGLNFLMRSYVDGIKQNPEAMRQIKEHYYA